MFKRYCKILTLKNDPELIRKYKEDNGTGTIIRAVMRGARIIAVDIDDTKLGVAKEPAPLYN